MSLDLAWVFLCLWLLCHQAGTVQAAKGHRGIRVRGVKWWNLAHTKLFMSDDFMNPTTPVYINPSLQPLTRKQRRLVAKNPGTVVAVARGAKLAVDECQYQFQRRRWNCPVADGSHGGSIFGKILRKGCRETAFIYAITSAAVTHSIARSCSEGSVYTCSCGHRIKRTAPGRDWEWGGCSDDADFGTKFSREFVDVVERGQDLRHLMNLHNNEAGRLQISNDMKQECKCHGMSGSCTIKTCWMRLPSFRRVGDAIKDRFDGASKVVQGNSGSRRSRQSSSSRFNLIPVELNHKPPAYADLVYYESSPTFCDQDRSIGFRGTRGRKCNATSIGIDGCDLMCCGRGFRTQTYVARKRCSCTFHWCCKVTCQICTHTEVRHTCL